jgi:hypothetical protein
MYYNESTFFRCFPKTKKKLMEKVSLDDIEFGIMLHNFMNNSTKDNQYLHIRVDYNSSIIVSPNPNKLGDIYQDL